MLSESKTQICLVLQLRNACRYKVWKGKKTFTADMKNIYNGLNQEATKLALRNFAQKWDDK